MKVANIRDLEIGRLGRLRVRVLRTEHAHNVWTPTFFEVRVLRTENVLVLRSKEPYCLIQGYNNMYLLTEWEGRTGKYLARGHGVRTERSEVRAP